MDWNTCMYKHIAERISNDDINKMLDVMIENCDSNGKYYESYNAEEFLLAHVHNSEVFILIDEIVRKEVDSETRKCKDLSFSYLEEGNIVYLKNQICDSILRQIEREARKRRDHRFYSRCHIGEIVDFDSCVFHFSFNGKIEFYKDGGWGLAESNGMVLVKNHLISQPSKICSLYCSNSYINTPYRIIQDRDTNKYGIMSYKSFHETIHCLYDKLEVIDYYEDHTRHFFIKAMKNNKWGCFDENCALVVDCKYDEIVLRDGFLECIKDAEYLSYESLEYDKDTTVIAGKKDLYNKEGLLLIGGYDNLDVNYGYMQFYFGTYYEQYYEEETDYLDNQYKLLNLRLNYSDSKCLILDKEFKTIIRSDNGFFRMPIGIVFESVQEIERFVPFGLLFKFQVDLSHLDNGFIYLHDFHGKQYLVPDYIARGFDSPEKMKEFDKRQIVEKSHSIEEKQKRIEEMRGLMGYKAFESIEEIKNDPFFCPLSYDNQEIFEDDEIVTIVKIDKEKRVKWHDYVNEVGLANYTIHYYRIKDKIGVFDGIGLHPAVYDAITRDSTDMDTYVASFEFCESPKQSFYNNPNFRRGWYFIHFYKINDDGTLIRMEDDWNIFNPTKQKWFPYGFITRHYDIGCYSDYHSDNRSDYTDEDVWDAMTDGMYGDYKGDVDFDKFGL